MARLDGWLPFTICKDRGRLRSDFLKPSLLSAQQGLQFSRIATLCPSLSAQDRDIVERPQQGLPFNPPLTLIDDADTQAKWYYRLKREYRQARDEGRPF
jgi:hypothetical protein